MTETFPSTLVNFDHEPPHFIFQEDEVIVGKLRNELTVMEKIGPGIWDTLQCAAASVKVDDDFDKFIWLRDMRLEWMRCAECKGEFQTYCDRNPIEGYRYIRDEDGRIIGASKWMHDLHNWVSIRLNENDEARGRLPTHQILEWHQYQELYDKPRLCDGPCGALH